MRISWGTVDKNGTAVSGGNNVSRLDKGKYRINFRFSNLPAIVGCQTRSGNSTEANTDGIVFPLVATEGAVAITGDNTGVRDDRSFSFVAVGETVAPMDLTPVRWGVIKEDGSVVSGSGGFKLLKVKDTPGHYEITFTGFTDIPAIVATQTNSGNLTEANTDGIVVPFLTSSSATLITGDNRSTPEYRSFSFIAVGLGSTNSAEMSQVQLGQANILWGSVNADGTIAGGSGGFWVGKQGSGMYVITFPAFANAPVIVGSQTMSGKDKEDNRDGMVFPWVNTNYAIAITGDANGTHEDRSFSFIAIGHPPANTE